MTTYWHIIKGSEFGCDVLQARWDEERAGNFVSAGYGNAPEGKGRDKLARYAAGDDLVVYAPGLGAIAVARVRSGLPYHVPQASAREHAHRRAVSWSSVIEGVRDAVPIEAIRACGVAHPRTLAVRMPQDGAALLIQLIAERAQAAESRAGPNPAGASGTARRFQSSPPVRRRA